MTPLQVPQPFDFHQTISEVVLCGCGGTGSQVARTLCRVIFDLRRRGHHTPTLKFVDPDLVEAKNVGRQMFTEADIGNHKATCLARRFNLAMGLNITAYIEPFDAEKHVARYGSLVVGCVDNHVTSQSGCFTGERALSVFRKVVTPLVSKSLHQPRLSLKVVIPKYQGGYDGILRL